MSQARKKQLAVLALLLGVGAGGVVYSADTGMNKDALKAAQQRVEAQAKSQRQACGRLKAQAKDVCETEAKGREKVAKAQLEASAHPGPEAEKKVKFARADADYELAKQRCKALQDRPRDACVARARHEREAAIRLAKVEKVQELNAKRREEEGSRRQALQKPAAAPRPS